MKILIVASVTGTASYEEMLAKKVYKYLSKQDSKVDFFLLPYKNNVLSLPEQIMAYRLLDVSAADVLITFGYPACFLNHPNKYIYLLDAAPSIHEYWDSEYGTLGNYQYSQILISINELETKEFAHAKKVFCSSFLLCQDIEGRTGIKTELLYMPELYTDDLQQDGLQGEEENYYICETYLPQYSRIFEFCTQLKSEKNSKIYFFIPDADIVYMQAFQKHIQRCGIEKCVKIIQRHPSQTEILKSKAGMFFDYQARRPHELLMRYISQEKSIVVADDSGYSVEIAKQYGKAAIVPFNTFCQDMSTCVKETSKRFNVHSIDFFVKGILQNENSTF